MTPSEDRLRYLLRREAERISVLSELPRDSRPARSSSRAPLRVIGVAALSLLGILLLIRTDRPITRLAGQHPAEAWATCSNAHGGYSIAYPSSWHRWTQAADSCSLFDPSPVAASARFPDDWIWRQGHHPTAALQVANYPSGFDYVLGRLGEFETIVSQSSTRVSGHRAVIIEGISSGSGMYPRGSRTYTYIVDRAGKAFAVSTVALADRASRFPEFKHDVDIAARSLRFHATQDSIVAFALLGAVIALVLAIGTRKLLRRRAE